MKNLLALIHDLDNSALSLSDLFDREKFISDEILTASTFNDISLADGQALKAMLNGIVKSKLAAYDKPQEKKAKTAETSIQEIFVQKIAKTAQNTAESTPFCNTGVADSVHQSEQWAFPRHLDNYKLISTSDGVIPVLRCAPICNSLVGIDNIKFSFCQSTFGDKYVQLQPEQVEDSVGDAIQTWLDQLLFEIFGFGIASKREKGMHFNKFGFDLQDNLGMVLYGHNNKRITVEINGTGCVLARKGWNEQLFKFLKVQAKSPKINRIDLAFDDFESEYVSVDLANTWDNEGLFWCGGRFSEINHLGDWKRINGKGRTLTIGNRSSSKYLRIYERGKKEGDSLSFWTRAELELKSTDRYLPLDILIAPSGYFKWAYPALEALANKLNDFAMPEKCELIEKQASINVDKALEIVKHQFGKYIRQFRKFINDEDLLNLIVSDKDVVPKRLNFSHAAVMQALRIGEPIKRKTITETPLFEGVPFLTSNANFYEGLTHAI
jgi:phage replication initiation protein